LDHPTSWFDREATISSSRLILVGRYAVAVEGGRTPLRSDLSSGVSTRLADREKGRRLFDPLRAGDVLILRWLDG